VTLGAWQSLYGVTGRDSQTLPPSNGTPAPPTPRLTQRHTSPPLATPTHAVMAQHGGGDSSGYAFFGAPVRDDLLGELGGLDDAELETRDALAPGQEEVDLNDLVDDPQEDLSFAALLAKQRATPAPPQPQQLIKLTPLSALPKPPAPPPGGAWPAPPGGGEVHHKPRGGLSALPPPPGFYGAPPAAAPPPLLLRSQPPPQGRPGAGAGPPPPQVFMLTAAEVERRALALAAAQAPHRPATGAMTVAQLEAKLTAAAVVSGGGGASHQQAEPRPGARPPDCGRTLVPWTTSGPGMEAPAPVVAPRAAARQPQPQSHSSVVGDVARHGSRYMTPQQVGSILRIQWAATHPGDVSPYVWDYYATALQAKQAGTPHAMRPVLPPLQQQQGGGENGGGAGGGGFVPLEGLGKIPWGNIRHPKPLLHLLTTADELDGSGYGGSVTLDKDGRVALRLWIEDCHVMLCEADDVTRLLTCGGDAGGRSDDALRKRKAALLDGIMATLRLPGTHEPPKRSVHGTDAMLAATGGLAKGRNLLARLVTTCPPAGAAKVLFSIGRCLRFVFSPPKTQLGGGGDAMQLLCADDSAALDDSYERLGAAAAVALGATQPAVLTAVLQAVASSGALPDLDARTGHGRGGAALLAALLEAGSAAQGAGAVLPQAWDEAFTTFFGTLSGRLAPAMRAAAAAQQRGAVAEAADIGGSLPVRLLLACGRHAPQAQADNLAAFLASLGVGRRM
jgi:DNA topoisomerase 2-associated protein PAT1